MLKVGSVVEVNPPHLKLLEENLATYEWKEDYNFQHSPDSIIGIIFSIESKIKNNEYYYIVFPISLNEEFDYKIKYMCGTNYVRYIIPENYLKVINE